MLLAGVRAEARGWTEQWVEDFVDLPYDEGSDCNRFCHIVIQEVIHLFYATFRIYLIFSITG